MALRMQCECSDWACNAAYLDKDLGTHRQPSIALDHLIGMVIRLHKYTPKSKTEMNEGAFHPEGLSSIQGLAHKHARQNTAQLSIPH